MQIGCTVLLLYLLIMIENITLTVPQLIVEPVDHWPSINKQLPEGLQPMLSPSFLRERFGKFAVLHAAVNEHLQAIYLGHIRNNHRRQIDYYYTRDTEHHGELKKIESVCFDLQQLTRELLSLLFSIDYINEHDDWPPNLTPQGVLALLRSNPRLHPDIEPHLAFIDNLGNICQDLGLFSIHPDWEVSILDDEPVIFTREPQQINLKEVKAMPLRELIENYNYFFRMTRGALKTRFPEWHTYGINELPKACYALKTTIPQISATKGGIKYGDRNFMMHLHFSPYYGHLGNKLMDFNSRHIFMNQLLQDIYLLHELEKSFINCTATYSLYEQRTKILFTTESLIYWIRKNIDELISFQYCLHILQTEGYEPRKLTISSIGNLLNEKKGAPLRPFFSAHLSALKRINEISNTFKHSFVTSETHMLIGKDEPAVNCLNMPWNYTKNTPTFHSYYLRDIIKDYDAFFVHVRSLIQTFQWPTTTDTNGAADSQTTHSTDK